MATFVAVSRVRFTSMEIDGSRFISLEVSGSFHGNTWKFPLSVEDQGLNAYISFSFYEYIRRKFR